MHSMVREFVILTSEILSAPKSKFFLVLTWLRTWKIPYPNFVFCTELFEAVYIKLPSHFVYKV